MAMTPLELTIDQTVPGWGSRARLEAVRILAADGRPQMAAALHRSPFEANPVELLSRYLRLAITPGTAPPVEKAALFRGGPERTGLYPAPVPNKVRLAWDFFGGARGVAAPAVASDGRVLFGDLDGYLHCLNAQGVRLWSFHPGSHCEIHTTPAISSCGKVIFGGGYRPVFCLDLATGAERWRFQDFPCLSLRSSPAITPCARILVGAYDNHLYYLDMQGRKLRSVDVGGPLVDTPTVTTDGRIVVPTRCQSVGKGTLTCLAPDGTQLWSQPAAGDVCSAVAVNKHGQIIFTNGTRECICLDRNGKRVWGTSAADPIPSAPAIAADGRILFGSLDFHLYCLDPQGNELWKFNAGRAIRSAPTVAADGRVLFGCDDGHLYCLDEAGRELWRYANAYTVETPAVLTADGRIVYATTEGRICCLESDE